MADLKQSDVVLGPDMRPAIGPALRPLIARRFFYHGTLPAASGGGFLFQAEVPAGMIAIISRVGGLVDVVTTNYSLRVNAMIDEEVRDIGFYRDSWVVTRVASSWSIRKIAALGLYVVVGLDQFNPIVIDEHWSFGLWAYQTTGVHPRIYGGGVSGYLMPKCLLPD